MTTDTMLRATLAGRLGPLWSDQSATFARAFRVGEYPRPGGASAVGTFVVHHSASPTSWTLRRLWDYHHRARGWDVGGYAIGVRSDGMVEYAVGPEYVTNGVWGLNESCLSIVAIGNYQSAAPSAALLQSVYVVLCTLDDVLGGRPWRGHGEVARPGHGTLCPGAFLRPHIRTMRGPEYGAAMDRPDAYP